MFKLFPLFKISILFFFFFCLCTPHRLVAQNVNDTMGMQLVSSSLLGSDSSLPQNLKRRKIIAAASAGLAYGTSLLVLNEAWYKNTLRSKFQFFNDNKEWLQVDKVGHAWTAYNVSKGMGYIWEWAGYTPKASAIFGAVSGTAYQTVIEILDGHSAKWGWSWGDIGASVLGSGLYLGQQLGGKDQTVQMKFSFHYKNYSGVDIENRANDLYGDTHRERILKDYNAQTYWLSVNMSALLPKHNVPRWLNIAVGYGADGLFGGFNNQWVDNAGNDFNRSDIPRRRQFYIAPDIDFSKIRVKNKFLKKALPVLNIFKMPAPALMFQKDKIKFYPLYF